MYEYSRTRQQSAAGRLRASAELLTLLVTRLPLDALVALAALRVDPMARLNRCACVAVGLGLSYTVQYGMVA